MDDNQAGSGGSGGSTGASSGVDGLGGGIYVQSTTSGDDMVLQNTIVAGSSRGANCAGTSSAAITDAGHDLSFPDTTCPGINGDPKLLGFNNFGGPTNTLGLAPGSAAIDQVPATGAGCPATDQRGVKRPQGSACDIGAFEFATPQITITSPADGATYTQGSIALAAYQLQRGRDHEPDRHLQGHGRKRPADRHLLDRHQTLHGHRYRQGRQPDHQDHQLHGHGLATRSSAIRSAITCAVPARPNTHGVRRQTGDRPSARHSVAPTPA